MSCGLDAGTYNLVCCTRDPKNGFQYTREVNAFIEIKLDNRYMFNLMKSSGIALIERDKIAYALGEAAVQMAYATSEIELKRPMCEGCVNPKEKDAFEIMSVMIHSMLEDHIKQDNEILYYTVPANAINEQTDVDYHSKVLQAILSAFESDKGFKVCPMPINEGLALVYAELASKAYTGIGISYGSGMVNVCYAMFGVPVFQFALVNSGDWIDKMAAKATGESSTFINQEKININLGIPATTLVERAIQTQYRIMIEKSIQGIKKGLVESSKKTRADQPVDLVIAGGTSMPSGFDLLFKEVLEQAGLPIKIGAIIRPVDPLYSVARGALIAAEAASQ